MQQQRSSSGDQEQRRHSGITPEPAIIPDFGILKSLQGMGDKFTKGFESLTHKISAVASASVASSTNTSNYHDVDDENAELNPLVQKSNTEVNLKIFFYRLHSGTHC